MQWYTHFTPFRTCAQSYSVIFVMLRSVLIGVTFYLELGFTLNCVNIPSIIEETLHDNTLMHEFLPLFLLSSLNKSVGIHNNDNDPSMNKHIFPLLLGVKNISRCNRHIGSVAVRNGRAT